MIEPKKLAEYMKYIIKTYPKGCAAHNWLNYYKDILNDKRLPEEYEFDNIVEESLNEFHSEIGLCGCGAPEFTQEVIRQILTIQSKRFDSTETYEERQKKFSDLCNSSMDNENYYGLIQFVLYIFDNRRYLEHGGSIGGAWLSEKGIIYLDFLNAWNKLNKDMDDQN